MKAKAILLAFAMGQVASAQVPDVAPFLELRPTWQVRSGGKNIFGWNDLLGRHSLVGLRMMLESGHRVYVAQKFQRESSSADPDTLDEYYIESRGHWRIGKQYLPFGRREIIRSTVLAARADTNLLFQAAPIAIAACDAGTGRTRGVFARVGGPIGISVAFGNHIGIQSTDLTKFQYPDENLGLNRGYRFALGLDSQTAVGSTIWSAEFVALRRGETAMDSDRNLSDLRARFAIPGTNYRGNAGWSRDWDDRKDYFTIEIELRDDAKISYVPFLRTDGLSFKDFGFGMFIKI